MWGRVIRGEGPSVKGGQNRVVGYGGLPVAGGPPARKSPGTPYPHPPGHHSIFIRFYCFNTAQVSRLHCRPSSY